MIHPDSRIKTKCKWCNKKALFEVVERHNHAHYSKAIFGCYECGKTQEYNWYEPLTKK